MIRTIISLLFILLFSSIAFAQEFEIKKYDVSARVDAQTYTIEAKARLTLVNLSGKDLADKILLAGPDNRPKISFYLNSKAKLSAATLGGAAAQFTSGPDRTGLQVISANITSAVAALPEFDVEFTYTIPLNEKLTAGQGTDSARTPGLLVTGLECLALPTSFWVPVKHTPYVEHGADTAPFTLAVTAPAGLKVVSSGTRTGDGTFDQRDAGQPFFIAGDYEVFASGGEPGSSLPSAPKVEVYAPRGLDEAGKQQAQRVAAEAARMIDFYTKYFGGPQGGTFRIVSSQLRERETAMTGELVSRGLNFTAPGLVTVSDSLFRRTVIDLGTIELLASAAARQWIDGRVLLRGRGAGLLRDALPVYLTAQYLGARFGDAQREDAFERYRRAYTPVARGGDAPLLAQSLLDRGYTTSMYNKGALVWRLIEKRVGKQAFDNLIRQSLERQRVDVLSVVEWRSPLCGVSRCGNLKAGLLSTPAQPGVDRQAINDLFAQWIEGDALPDFRVGQPQPGAAGIESTVANFGTGDFAVEIVATTAQGQRLKQTVMVKSGEFPVATFPAGTQIKVIEVDPDRVYIQKDYSNDSWPPRPSDADLYSQAARALGNYEAIKSTEKDKLPEQLRKLTPEQELVTAEAKAREAVAADPDSPTLQALLGRILLAAKKNEEAARAFAAALKSEPVPIQAYAWSQLGSGELAMQQNKSDEAARRFREAAATDLDKDTILAARNGSLRAERAAGAVKLPEDVKGFLQRFDAAILQGSTDAVAPLVEQGTLRRFARSVAVTKPSAWVTEPLRTETLDANRIAVDVRLKVQDKGKEYSGTALYVLSRAGGKLLLNEVPIFDVK
ncbi:MAG TPA: hypothetical protein VFD58_11515 [Blastocatellia bacterium]|nr:hypothetical protein [Blastocatellia bacterium]